MHIHMYIHMYVYTYIHTREIEGLFSAPYVYTYIHMYIHTYVYTYIHTREIEGLDFLTREHELALQRLRELRIRE